MSNKRIESLIKEQETIDNKALKNAIQRQIESEQRAQEDKLVEQFQQAKSILSVKVSYLRNIRAEEAQQLKAVKECDAAYEQFKKDGDFDSFLNSIVY